MNRRFSLGAWLGLKITISARAIVWNLFVAALLAAAAAGALALAWPQAALAGLLSAMVLLLSDWIHQLGHAFVARRLGHPMVGIHFHSIFSASVYPKDEPPLPPRVHIARALGGFWVNVLIGLALTPAAPALWPGGGVWAWVAAFAALVNLFVVGLGALLPIDIPGVFTIDGGTIWHYWREMHKSRES